MRIRRDFRKNTEKAAGSAYVSNCYERPLMARNAARRGKPRLYSSLLCRYSAGFQNIGYRSQGCIDFGVGVVEVR
jgi:hypothetical protein